MQKKAQRWLAVFVLCLVVYLTWAQFVVTDKADVSEAPHSHDESDVLNIPSGSNHTPEQNIAEAIEQKNQMLQQPMEAQGENGQAVCHTDAVRRNTDSYHTNANLFWWQSMKDGTVQSLKNEWQTFAEKQKYPSGAFKGRGIVIVAGNGDTFSRSLATIRLLRSYGCMLPIDIWHLPHEASSDATTRDLDALQVTLHDLSDPRNPRPVSRRYDTDKQFQVKAAAIINSSFKEVLYLDSDNVPTRDPSFLFDTPGYRSTGAVFWPDFWKTHAENKIFNVLGLECTDEWEQESGQIVLDKERSWVPLQLAWYMQQNYQTYFRLTNGDKDTFRFAWKALGAPYYMTRTFLGVGGFMDADRLCGHTMIQYSDDALEEQTGDQLQTPLFVHANLLKITPSTLLIDPQTKAERPWQHIKWYENSKGKTWLLPQFYIGSHGQACMDLISGGGEPELKTVNFDTVLPGFQDTYLKLGGPGGKN